MDVGFSYFDKIKVPRAHEAFQRNIILCSKSYGATPSSIRNDCRDEAQLWRGSSSSDLGSLAGPPPVSYTPLTPSYTALVSPRMSSTHLSAQDCSTPTLEYLHSEVSSSSATDPSNDAEIAPGEATPHVSDATITVPDSTSDQ